MPIFRSKYTARRIGAAIVLAVLLLVAFVFVSAAGAALTPGNESFQAKWTDWLRSHHGSVLIAPLESYYYGHHQPKKGGAPVALHRLPSTVTVAGTAPPPVALVVSPALANEGRWVASGPLVNGVPAMYISQFRADDVFTSQITTAVWINPKALAIQLVAGAREPGGTWIHPPYTMPTELARAVAAFNGGFRFQDAHGGIYLDGREGVPLRTGTASVVIYRDGHVNIGEWGRDVNMTPDVVSVLQNLTLLVDNGQIDPAVSHNDTKAWGTTISGRIAVARSGIGVTAHGDLVYVAGPALTAKGLAESLQRAGAVRAMTLDINPEWVTFNLFEHPDPANPAAVVGAKLYPQQQRPSTRYLPPTHESRDFFLVTTR